MTDERLEDWERWPEVGRELRREPRVDPAAVARLEAAVRAVAAERAALRAAPEVSARPGVREWLFRPRPFALSPAAGLAIAAGLLVAAVSLGRARRSAPAETAPAVADARTAAEPSITARAATARGDERAVQFVFVDSAAVGVSLVGDFNDWDPRATPLRQTAAGGVWSVVVPLAPGRHVYSFVVDGKAWKADAAAPRAPDSEFGGENSVVLVDGGTS